LEIDAIYDLLENNQIKNRLDKAIAEKIIEAENDWVEPIENLQIFIQILENETSSATKEELENLLNKLRDNNLPKNVWKAESISSLLEIFDYTGYHNLKAVFREFTDKYSSKIKNEKTLYFNIKGYPIIKVFEKHFEIKAIDHWEFRTFKYCDLKKVKLINPMNNWWYRLFILTSWQRRTFADTDPIKLNIIKRNNGDWTYLTTNRKNTKFTSIIKEINLRIASCS